jgi:hypothetical protein
MKPKALINMTDYKSAVCFVFLSALSSGITSSANETFSLVPGTNWMSIYLNGDKIGYSSTSIEKSKGEGYILTYESSMNLTIDGKSRPFRTTTAIMADKNLNVKSFESKDDSDGTTLTVKGNTGKEWLQVITEAEGAVSTNKYALATDWTLPEVIPFLMTRKIISEETRSFNFFDTYSLDWIPAKAKLVKDETGPGVENKTMHALELTCSSLSQTFWLDEHGMSWKEKICMGKLSLDAFRESKEKALANDRQVRDSTKDLVLLSSIPPNVVLYNVSNLSELKLVLGPVLDEGLNLTDRRQEARFISVEGRKWIELDIRKKPFDSQHALAAPISLDNNLREFLRPTLFTQSDDKEIRNQAREIASSETNSWRIVQQLIGWMDQQIGYRRTVSRTSALEVLHGKTGGCNEHAVLLAALARSIGIPTKMCLGLAYQEGRFYYHAWNKVYVGEWVDVDPTFGDTDVDVTHILLWEGNTLDPSRMASLMGTLNIKIESSVFSRK